MVRVSLTHVLLFIAVISVSTMFVGVIVTETGLYAQSAAGESDRAVAAIDAEIDVVNDAEAGSTYDDGEVTVYVKNVGGSSLEPADADLVLDGEYVEPNGTTVFGYPDTAWREGSVLELTAPASLEPGDHRVLVEIDGAQESLEFEHRIAYWTSPAGQNGTADDCDAETCTVSLSDSDGELTLEMATDLDQPDAEVAYASSDETVATVDPETGTTDATGTDSTTLHLDETGETTVSLDVGWDADEIVINVEE